MVPSGQQTSNERGNPMKSKQVIQERKELKIRLNKIFESSSDWMHDPKVTQDLMFLAFDLGLRDGPDGHWFKIHGSEAGRFSMFSHLAYVNKQEKFQIDSRQPGCNRRLAIFCNTLLDMTSVYTENPDSCNFSRLVGRAADIAAIAK